MILTQSQAQGIYETMCTANNFNGRIGVSISGSLGSPMILVRDKAHLGVFVVYQTGGATRDTEHYLDQASFAAAYKLN